MQTKRDAAKEELNQYYFNDEQLEDLEHVPAFEPRIKSAKRSQNLFSWSFQLMVIRTILFRSFL